MRKLRYNYDAYEIHVSGDGSQGERICVISLPVQDTDNRFLYSESVFLKGEDFNHFWENYNTDKDAIKKLFELKEVEANLDEVNETVLNKEGE